MTSSAEKFELPASVCTLADACSLHFRSASRLWTVAAALSLVVLTSVGGTGPVKILGIDLERAVLYPATAAILALVNIAYCSAHMQAYRVMRIYHALLDSISADSVHVTPEFTLADVAHSLYAPTLNRIYPLTHSLPPQHRERARRILKVPTDVFFYTTPLASCVFALFQTESWGFVVVILPIVFVSTFAWVMLLVQAWHSIFGSIGRPTARAAHHEQPANKAMKSDVE